MSNKAKFIESVIRIIFGGLCLIAGLVVEVILPGPYTMVSVVLFINGIACVASGTVNLVRVRRDMAKKREEELLEMAKEIEKVL